MEFLIKLYPIIIFIIIILGFLILIKNLFYNTINLTTGAIGGLLWFGVSKLEKLYYNLKK